MGNRLFFGDGSITDEKVTQWRKEVNDFLICARNVDGVPNRYLCDALEIRKYYEKKISELTAERDEARTGAAVLGKERDSALRERDAALKRVEELVATCSDYKKEAVKLTEEYTRDTVKLTLNNDKLESENSELKKKVEELNEVIKEEQKIQNDNVQNYLDQENMLVRQNKELHDKLRTIESKKAVSREEITESDIFNVLDNTEIEVSGIKGFLSQYISVPNVIVLADSILAILPASNPDMVRCPGEEEIASVILERRVHGASNWDIARAIIAKLKEGK